MNIGFIGLGTMGAPMASRLLHAGYDVTVHNRTRAREEPLERLGAARAATPRDAAEGADVVFTMVGDGPDVVDVVLGREGAALAMGRGSVLVDMSTISPAVARSLGEELARRSIDMIDAPCSGGSEGARNGTLSFMVGGASHVVDAMRPVLSALGSKITRVGEIGAGQVCKAVNQVVIAGTYAGVAEGLALALASGIDVEAALEAIGGGAAGSWGLTNRGPNMIAGSYPLGFRTRLHRKDLGIAMDTASDLRVPLPLATWVAGLEDALIARGFGDEDVSNVARAFREAAGVDDEGDGRGDAADAFNRGPGAG